MNASTRHVGVVGKTAIVDAVQTTKNCRGTGYFSDRATKRESSSMWTLRPTL
jgi:hypothetical protein